MCQLTTHAFQVFIFHLGPYFVGYRQAYNTTGNNFIVASALYAVIYPTTWYAVSVVTFDYRLLYPRLVGLICTLKSLPQVADFLGGLQQDSLFATDTCAFVCQLKWGCFLVEVTCRAFFFLRPFRFLSDSKLRSFPMCLEIIRCQLPKCFFTIPTASV